MRRTKHPRHARKGGTKVPKKKAAKKAPKKAAKKAAKKKK
jgi:hypothetical protein